MEKKNYFLRTWFFLEYNIYWLFFFFCLWIISVLFNHFIKCSFSFAVMLLQKLIFFLSLKVENLRESLPQDIKWIAGNLLLTQYKFHDVNFYSRVQILTMVQKDCGRSPTNLCQAEKSHFSLPTPLATTMEPRWKMDKSQRSFSTPRIKYMKL